MRTRAFATSVVVTISLAEAACATGVRPDTTRNPPPPEVEEPPETEEPQAEETAAEHSFSVEIHKRADGSCHKVVDMACPEGVACNPPPPEPVTCPAPALPKAGVAANVFTREDGTCWEGFDMNCPKGARCNPPPPRPVQCEGKALPDASNPQLIEIKDDGTCWEAEGQVNCPPVKVLN